MIIGDKIAELRKEMGLTQEQLGALVGVSSQAVSKWENGGTPDVELLPLIADTLGVSLDGLFGREEKPGTDLNQTLIRYLLSFPAKNRMQELYHLLMASMAGMDQLRNSEALLPFLYFARWLMEKSDLYLYAWIQRRKPWLS